MAEVEEARAELGRRPGVFEQRYDGWIFEVGGNPMPEVAGIFSHNGVAQYGWHGKFVQ